MTPCHACGAPAADLAALCAGCSRSTRSGFLPPEGTKVHELARALSGRAGWCHPFNPFAEGVDGACAYLRCAGIARYGVVGEETGWQVVHAVDDARAWPETFGTPRAAVLRCERMTDGL